MIILLLNWHFGLSSKRVKDFRKYLTNICKTEPIYLQYCENYKELNKLVFNKTDVNIFDGFADGVYTYNNSRTHDPIKKVPKIIISKKPTFTETLSIMTFAHEVGHHFAITKNNDEREHSADLNAIKLFIKFFPSHIILFNLPLLGFYSIRNLMR